MTTPTHDFERLLTTWLDSEAPTVEPKGLSQESIEQTAKTRQMPGWVFLERWVPMQTTARIGPAARAVILLVTLGLLTALTVGVLTAAFQKPLPPPFGLAGNGLIAYSNEGDIWVVDQDGTRPRRLTDTPDVVESRPVWSRDGTQIAFWAGGGSWEDPAPGDLIVMGPDGTGRTVIAPGVSTNSWFEWSTDGSAVVYDDGIPGISAPRIFIAPIDGSGAKQIGDAQLDAWTPVVSPDGDTIAFLGGRYDDEKDIFLMSKDGSNVRRLGSGKGDRLSAYPYLEFSADGLRLLSATAGTANPLAEYDLRTGEWREIVGDLLEVSAYWSAASLSPDGSRIAIVAQSPVSELFMADADGSRPGLVDGVELDSDTSIQWAPDGSRLIAQLAAQTNADVAGFSVIDPDGLEPTFFVPTDDWGFWIPGCKHPAPLRAAPRPCGGAPPSWQRVAP